MEIWKDIRGYEGLYQVSNKGKVKSLARIVGSCKRKESILSNNRLTKDGYVRIALGKDSVAKENRLHAIVAKHFIINEGNKETINHIDGNKLNNAVYNLEWSTREENMQHAYKLGLKKPKRGSSNALSKLTDSDVEYIRKSYVWQSQEFGTVALARKYGVTNVVIGKVVRGETYKNV